LVSIDKYLYGYGVDDYLEEFETQRAQMLVKNPDFNKVYFLSSFIRELWEEISLYVKLFRPSTFSHAIEQATM